MKTTAIVLLLVAALGLPSSASAGTPRSDAMDLAAQASVGFKLGKFEEALAQFSSAYEKFPTPGLLFNIGQCHKMLRHHEQAIYFFQGYLRDKPDAGNRPVVEQLIAESKQALEDERAEAAREEQRRQAVENRAAPASVQAAHSQGNSSFRLVGFIAAGLGAAALGVGIFFGVRASSDASELDQLSAQRGSWSSQYQSVYDAGKTAAPLADILVVGGAVALAGGGALVVLGWPKSGAEKSPAATVSVAPAGMGLALRGAF